MMMKRLETSGPSISKPARQEEARKKRQSWDPTLNQFFKMLKSLFIIALFAAVAICSASTHSAGPTAYLYVIIDERSDEDCNSFTHHLKNPVSILLGTEVAPCLAVAEGLLFHAQGPEPKARST